MKENAPEKIYLTPLECMAASCQPKKDNTIEYTRTDAFIKKALGRLKHYLDNGMWIANDVGYREKEAVVEDFKNYMKGE